jgi:hypothetical protein
MKKRRSGKISKFGAIALCGCAVLFGLWLAWSSGGSQQPTLAELPAAEQQKRREDVQQLEEQAKDIAGKAKSKVKAQFKLRVSQEQVNTMLQDRLKEGKAPIRDPQVALSPGTLTLNGTVDYKGVPVPATLTGAVNAQNGQVTFRANSLKISGFPAPGALKSTVEREINQHLSRGLTEAPIKIDDVTVGEGELTISGVTD